MNLHMNIIVKWSTKWAEKNTFWNKIKCYVTFHTVSVMFSHVFPAVGIQNVKVQKRILEEVWSFASVMVLLSRAGFKQMTSSNAAALCTQNDRCMTSKHCESYREQTAHTESIYNDSSACFRIALAVLWCHTLIVCAVLLQVQHTDTFCPLLELQSANFSPPPLRKNKMMK